MEFPSDLAAECAIVLGIDGCRGGWVAVALAGERRAVHAFARLDEAATLVPRRALIDIPIGLPATGRRGCDIAARALLGTARSRIFLDARRPLLDYRARSDYAGAQDWAKRDGKGFSRQLWHILDKIAEADRFVTPERQEIYLEAHPELAFLRLAGGAAALPNKKTKPGQNLRRDLVLAAGIAEIDEWLARRPPRVAADDLLDACALALAARDPLRVPCAPAHDPRGLRMEIWY
jgi:predicted RNase H-like nuclease